VASAFEGLMKDGLHPGYFLFLEVNPKSIDINIHPTKTEIKFDDEHAIYAMLRATIKHSLGQFSIAPVLDFNKEAGFETPYSYKTKSPQTPTIEVDRSFNPFKIGSNQGHTQTSYRRESSAGNTSGPWESLYVGLKEDTFEGNTEELSGSLFSDDTKESGQATFQLQNKYIISPIKSGLMVIHQNLAHQRVLYEELLRNITVQEAVSQQLLFPLALDFPKVDVAIISKVKEQLEHTGFVFSICEGDKLEVSGVPVSVSESEVVTLLEQLIADIKDEVPDAGFSQNDLLVKSMAKSMAVKTGTSLSKEAQEHLVHQLFACKEPSVSPDNRKVLITLDATDFDKKFS
jgi:DNA mismatch repair protein MutL